MKRNHVLSINKLINLIMFIYILSLYFFTYREQFYYISNIIAAILLGLILVNKLIIRKRIIINNFLVLYMIFIIFCLMSVFYAIDSEISFIKLRTLILLFVLMFSIINYIDSYEKLFHLMKYFSYSGFGASLYILLKSDFSNLTRYGADLGNVNAIGMILCISSTFSLYFFIEDKKFRFIPIFLTNSIVILMTGSRKSLILLIFSVIILLLSKVKRKNIVNKINIIIFSIIFVMILLYLVFNVPFFYQIIGRRMENLLKFVLGKGTLENSINLRFLMIKHGWEWFKERPVLGYGLDNYRILLGKEIGKYTYSHNNIIELLVDIGIFGTVLYYFIQFNIIKNLYNISKIYNKPLAYSFIAILLGYMFISVALIYYDSKHFCIILAVGSTISSLYKNNKHINLERVADNVQQIKEKY